MCPPQPKDLSLNRVNHIIDLKYEISTQRLHPVPMLSFIGSKIIIIKYERIGLSEGQILK